MILKKLIAGTAFIFMFALVAIAQPPQSILSHTEELELTAEQVTAIEQLHTAHKSTKSGTERVPRKVGVNTKPSEFKTGLEEILTEDQMSKWTEITAMRREERKAKHEGREGKAKHKEARTERKGLREERQVYIAENIAPAVQKHRLEFENSLSNAEKEVIADARTKRAQARPINGDRREKISSEDRKAQRQALSEIVSNHKEELDAIWADLGDNMTTWNTALMEMAPEKGKRNTENRGERTKNRKHVQKRGEFSHLEFVLIDY